MSKGAFLIIFGLLFCYLETWYFGWNWNPSSNAEVTCDAIATICVLTGSFMLVSTSKKDNV